MKSAATFAREAARSLRRLGRSPVTGIVAIVSLGIGVAATGLAGGLVWQQVAPANAYRDESGLAQVYATNPSSCPSCIDGFSQQQFDRWRAAGLSSFSRMSSFREASLAAEDRRERSVHVAYVDDGFFDVLGSMPMLGRVLTADDHAGAALNAVASNRFWRARLGGRRSAIGTSLDLGGQRIQVVGVMSPAFRVPDGADLWLPGSADADGQEREAYDRFAIARLSAGVSAEAAQAELAVVAAREAAAIGPSASGRGTAVFGSTHWPGRSTESSVMWVVGVTTLGLVLLCLLNVSHVFSVGALARLREFAIRRALGASDMRLRIALLADAIVIASLGAAVSIVVFAVGAPRATEYLASAFSYEATTASIALFAVYAPLISAAFACALALPAIRYVRANAGHDLLRGGSSSTPVQQRLRSWLVSIQLAGVFVVIAGASLMSESYRVTRDTSTGFDEDEALVAELRVDGSDVAAEPRVAVSLAAQAIAAAMQERPVAVWSMRSLDHFNPRRAVLRTTARGEVYSAPAAELWNRPYPSVSFAVSPETFSVLGISIVEGRGFTEGDRQGTQQVAIVNEAAARRLWPDARAVGQQFQLGDESSQEPWLTVVGVVENTVHLLSAGLNLKLVSQGRDPALMFQPYAQAGNENARIAVRAPAATAVQADAIDRQVERALPPSVRMSSELISVRRWMAGASMVRRVKQTTELLMGIAVAAILIALVGVYGLADELVRTRASEIALRRALGAPRGRVLSWIGARLLKLLALASVGGALASLGLATLAGSVLYGHRGEEGAIRTGLAFGVSAHEPRFYIVAGACCAIMLALGAARPLAAAMRIQPAEVLKGGE